MARTKNAGPMPEPGDTFVFPVAEDVLGSCRVLRVGNPFTPEEECQVLWMVSEWFGHEPPPLDEPALRRSVAYTHPPNHRPQPEAVEQLFGKPRGLMWCGPPTAELRPIGNVRVSAEEAEVLTHRYGTWETILRDQRSQYAYQQDPEGEIARWTALYPPGPNLLTVTEETLESDVERYAGGGFDGVTCPAALLRHFPGDPVAWITVRDDADRAALQGQTHLTRIHVSGPNNRRVPVDLSGFEGLVELGLGWHPSTVLPRELPRLEDLFVHDYVPDSGRSGSSLPAELPSLRKLRLTTGPAKTVPPLPRAERVEHFEYLFGRVDALTGLAMLPNVRFMKIDGQSRLTNIGEVATLRLLEHAVFASCRRLTVFSPLGECPNLRVLSILGSPKVESIGFLRSCPRMAEFACLDGAIVDGDLTPLIGVEQVDIDDKRHYSHTEEELRELTARLRRGEPIEVQPPASASPPAPADGSPALPTDGWLEDLPEGFPRKGVRALHVRLQRFVEDMAEVPTDAPVSWVLNRVKWVVIDIGEINDYHGDFLDTGAREELVGFIHDIVADHAVGEWGDDLTERWRRW